MSNAHARVFKQTLSLITIHLLNVNRKQTLLEVRMACHWFTVKSKGKHHYYERHTRSVARAKYYKLQ